MDGERRALPHTAVGRAREDRPMTTDRDRPAPTLSVPAKVGKAPVDAPDAALVGASRIDAPTVDERTAGLQTVDVRSAEAGPVELGAATLGTVTVGTEDLPAVDRQTGTRLAELAARTNLGALDTLLAVAAHAGAAAGRNAEAAAAARRLGRRMTTSMAQFRIAAAPR